jgi:hypothetical protein
LKQQGVQSFLWTGPEGAGKKTHALSLARSLFCQQGTSCFGCPSCKQVLAKTHPDLFWVDREHFWHDDPDEKKKKELTVKVALNLSEKLHRAPLSAPLKVAVIPDASEMNESAQNVLLKTLEEPPAKTLIILIAEKTGDFLATVLSRCRIVRFPALSTEAVETALVQGHGWDRKKAREAALGSNGNLVLALKSIDPNWMDFHDKVCADLDRVLQGSDDAWLKLVSEYDQWEPEFLGDAEITATQRKAKVTEAALQAYLGLWSRRLSNEAETPKSLSTLPADQVLKCLRKHQDMVASNLGTKMIMDHLFLELCEGFKTGAIDDRSFMELSVQI